MILSHRHRFIFIKGMKVAGTTAEIALSQMCGPDDIITPITRVDERERSGTAGMPRNYTSHIYPAPIRRHLEQLFLRSIAVGPGARSILNRVHRYRFVNHMDLRTVLRMVPSAKNYEILCVERSPYAKVMSLANWVEHHQTYGKGEKLPSDRTSFANAVDRLIEDGSIKRVLNVDRYRHPDGSVSVRPWRSRTLDADISEFFKSRGAAPVALVNAKRGANSDLIDPAEGLRADQLDVINEIFAEEFELLGWPMISGRCSRAG